LRSGQASRVRATAHGGQDDDATHGKDRHPPLVAFARPPPADGEAHAHDQRAGACGGVRDPGRAPDAAGIKEMGAYVRGAVLAQRPPPSVVPAVNREAWVALARTASNLNQLSAHLNAGHLPGAVNPVSLRDLLVALTEEVRALRLALLGVTPEEPGGDAPGSEA